MEMEQQGLLAQHVKNNNASIKKTKTSINVLMDSILDGEKMRKRFDELLGKRTPQFLSALTSQLRNYKRPFVRLL